LHRKKAVSGLRKWLCEVYSLPHDEIVRLNVGYTNLSITDRWIGWQAALEAYSVRETVHYAPACEVTQIQRNSIPHALWQLGDARLVWVNEGDIIKAGILVEGEPCARAAKSEGK
jgi:hypothetical protein